jgi:uncharacterized membrane protein
MPADITWLDLVAFAWFVGVWAGYNLVMDHLVGRGAGLNRHLQLVRLAWMRQMARREQRITDAALVGNAMQSVSFFASTTMLVLAGLIGMLAAVDQAHAVVGGLSFAARTSRDFFELKMLLLGAIFVYAFFRFTWALRQFNYACALIGAAPPPGGTADEALAAAAGEVLSLAAASFNGGLRAYYFALAVLTWFVQPWLFMLFTAGMFGVLLRRQFASRTFAAIRDFGRAAGRSD